MARRFCLEINMLLLVGGFGCEVGGEERLVLVGSVGAADFGYEVLRRKEERRSFKKLAAVRTTR